MNNIQHLGFYFTLFCTPKYLFRFRDSEISNMIKIEQSESCSIGILRLYNNFTLVIRTIVLCNDLLNTYNL